MVALVSTWWGTVSGRLGITYAQEPVCKPVVSHLPECTGLKRNARSRGPRSARRNPVHSALFLTHDEYLDEPSAATHFSETLTPAGPRSHTSYTPPEGSQETPPTCSGRLWMGLAGLSSSLWSHHDPQISAPHSQNTNSIRREGGDQPRCHQLSLIWWEEEGDFKPASD